MSALPACFSSSRVPGLEPQCAKDDPNANLYLGHVSDAGSYFQGIVDEFRLYKRALGMSVTHGCVRVGDDDLEVIYKAVRIGSRVYII